MLLLFLLAVLVCSGFALLSSGPVAGLIVLLTGAVVGGLALAVRAFRSEEDGEDVAWIVVDGSNVLHWERDTPDIRNVGHVISALKSEGYAPVVWFDANVGYLIGDRYMGPRPLARMIGLPEHQVHVAPKGTPADPLLLEGALALKARVVTNDRFRDWEERFPKIREAGFLVRGFASAEEVALEWER